MVSFRVIYVEDDSRHRQNLENAVAKFNDDEVGSRRIELVAVASIAEFKEMFSPITYDLVIADVFYAYPKDEVEGKHQDKTIIVKKTQIQIDELSEIISHVEKHPDNISDHTRFPIIAYTSKGTKTLNRCLGIRDQLFDIWDKSSCSPKYVAWRISEIAKEISRYRPDSVLVKNIRSMSSGISWHPQVKRMADGYDRAPNEKDQIVRATNPINHVSSHFGTKSSCSEFWKSLTDWEGLSRSVSKKVRGHARHVINVFWLGYYIMHQPQIRPKLLNLWRIAATRHRLDHLVNDKNDDECFAAFSNAWFYAAFFHDSTQFLQKYKLVDKFVVDMINRFVDQNAIVFDESEGSESFPIWTIHDELMSEIELLFGELGRDTDTIIRPLWEKSLSKNAPDHGITSAAYLRLRIKRECPDQYDIAKEASRGMAIHNLVGDIKDGQKLTSWKEDPIACLLILCDQIQTWDRERGDVTFLDDDKADNAELTLLEILEDDEKLLIDGRINYLGPNRLNHSPSHLESAIAKLEEIIFEFPVKSLKAIKDDWPFDVRIECWLNDRKLANTISN